MSSKETEVSATYQEVLEATESIHPPAIGFAAPQEGTVTKVLNTVIKQNNTIIQYLAVLERRIANLEARNGSRLIPTQQLEDITEKLKNLSIGAKAETGRPKRPAFGPFLVFKDPRQIYKEEKSRLLGSSKLAASSVPSSPSSSKDKGKGKEEDEQQQ